MDCFTKDRENRIYSFSYIRALSCIAIIVLHTVYAANRLFIETLTNVQDVVSQGIVNCLMWAVPCFIMVTGALLLNEDRIISYGKLFKKYILRIFFALVVFGIIFRIFDIVLDMEEISIQSFIRGFYEIFTGTSWSHIWYLYLLISLYLLLPFYKKIVKYSTDKELKYLLFIYVIFLSILPNLEIWNINCGFYIQVSTIYPFYLFCGYMIHKSIFKIEKKLSIVVFIVSTIMLFLFTYLSWKHNIPSMKILWGYSSIFVIIQSASFFSLINRIFLDKVKWLKWVLLRIDRCSFGIYLIHVMFIRIIFRYMEFNPYTHGSVISFFVIVVIILSISYIITLILKLLPGFKQIL